MTAPRRLKKCPIIVDTKLADVFWRALHRKKKEAPRQ